MFQNDSFQVLDYNTTYYKLKIKYFLLKIHFIYIQSIKLRTPNSQKPI